MSEGSVRYVQHGPVGRVIFDRPAARNAMTWAMYAELGELCRRLADERSVRVVIFRGAGGKAFVAGTDIAGFTDFASGEVGLRYEADMDGYLSTVEALPMPTVAVIEGWAVGGGLMIAAACDFRIATPDARFGAPIARTLGNCLSAKGYARLLAGFGTARAKRILLLGEMLTADETEKAGFLTGIADPDTLDATVDSLCERLLKGAPLTQAASKEALRRLAFHDLPDIDDLVHAVYGSEDFQRGVKAFLAKTDPGWTGR